MQNRLLEIKATEQMGRGMFARQYIPLNTLIMTVQDSAFFTYSLLSDHPLFSSIMNQTGHKIVQFAYFMAYLNYEEKSTSQLDALKQYMAALPTTYHNLVCWNDRQLDKLDNKKLVNKIKDKKDTLVKAYIEILANLFDKQNRTVTRECSLETQSTSKPTRGNRQNKNIKVNQNIPVKQSILGKITLEDVVKFVAVIQSRNAYYINADDTRSAVGALIPDLQIFNHSKHSKCRVSFADKQYKVFTVDNIEKGEQIFLDYGSHEIEYFLEFYGMIPFPDVQKQNNTFLIDKTKQIQLANGSGNLLETQCLSERDLLAIKYNDLYRNKDQSNKKQQIIGKNSGNYRIALLELN